MKDVLDASLLVTAHVEGAQNHRKAANWLNEAISLDYRFYLADHTLAEFYAGLTKYRQVKPIQAKNIIETFVEEEVEKVIRTSSPDYFRAINRVAQDGHRSGIIYDAIIAEAARWVDADYIVTGNRKHFKHVWPENKIITPF